LTLIVVGDSTTEQYFIADGQTWVEALNDRLIDEFDSLWVNNAGVTGHSTYGHNFLIEDTIIRLRPDAVLLLVGANDLGLYRMGPNDLGYIGGFHSWEGAVKWAALHCETCALLYNSGRALEARRLEFTGPVLDVTALESLPVSGHEAEQVEAKWGGPALSGYRDRLIAILTTLQSGGIYPILVTQPALFGPGIDPATGVDLNSAVFYGFTGAHEWALLEMYNDVTRQVAEELNVPLLDLARWMPRDSRNYYDMLHFNYRGSLIASGLLEVRVCELLAVQFPEYPKATCPDEPPEVGSESGSGR